MHSAAELSRDRDHSARVAWRLHGASKTGRSRHAAQDSNELLHRILRFLDPRPLSMPSPAPKIVHYIALDHIYFGPDFNLPKNFKIAFQNAQLCDFFDCLQFPQESAFAILLQNWPERQSLYKRPSAISDAGRHLRDDLSAYVAPLGWKHIALRGDYVQSAQ